LAEKSFTLKLRKSIDDNFSPDYKDYYKKGDLINTSYQLYYHKNSNKLFIIAYANQVGKMKPVWGKGKDPFLIPYNGIFSFDLATNTLMVLAENPHCASGMFNGLKDKWYFFNDNLIRRYVDKENSFYSKFNLSTLNQNDLINATKDRNHYNKEPESWKNPLAGIDLKENLYFVNPANNHIEIYYFDKSNMGKGNLVTILHSSNKLNNVVYNIYENNGVEQEYAKNIISISPSGKNVAYLCLNNRTDVGNYASM
jgi:hypothetical protein